MSQHVYLFYTEANSAEAQQVSNDLKALQIPCIKAPSTADKTQQVLNDTQGIALLLVSDNFLKDLTQTRHLEQLMEELPSERLVPVLTHGRRPKKGEPDREEAYPTRIQTLNDVMYYRDYWYEAWIALRKAAKNVEGQELDQINEQKEIAKRLSVGNISNHIRSINQSEPIEWEALYANDYQLLIERTGLEADANYQAEDDTIPTIDLPVEAETTAPVADASAERKETSILEKAIIQESDDSDTEPPLTIADVDVPIGENLEEEEETSTEVPSVEEIQQVDLYEEKALKEVHVEETETLSKEEEDTPERIPVADIAQVEEPFTLDEKLDDLEDLDAQEILARYEVDAVDSIDLLFHIAESQTEEDQAQEARHTYERILSLDPYNGRALIWLARLLAKQEETEDHTEAAQMYRKAIMVNDDNPNLYYEYGLLQKEEKAYHKASESFREALLLDGRYEEAYFGLAQCLKEMGRMEEAKANYLQACILDAERFETAENDNYFKVIRLSSAEGEPEETQSEALEAVEEQRHPNADTVVLVTGATSGIGRSIAGQFVLSGYKVILAGRRTERLEGLKNLLEEHLAEAQVHCLTLDVRDLKAVKEAIHGLPEGWKDIDILVNNAGLAKGFAPIHEGNTEHWETMIDTNLKGLLYVSRAVTPGMVARQRGHVINLGSVAGVEAYAGGGVYCATKAGVDSLTRSMRLDLYQYHIKVTAIHPGHVEETEFAKVRYEDAEKAKIYEDFKPLSAKDVADTVVYVATRPEHVNIQSVLLFGTQQASATNVDRSGRDFSE